MVINKKERFATEGIRFQRLNPDGTIPTPQRFIGFANTVNLAKFLPGADLTIKIDSNPAETKTVSLEAIENPQKVTVQEMIDALNHAAFTDVVFSVDEFTDRLKGSYQTGTYAQIAVTLENISAATATIINGDYLLMAGNVQFHCAIIENLDIEEGQTVNLLFIATRIGVVNGLPAVNEAIDITAIVPELNDEIFEGTVNQVTNGVNPAKKAEKVQVIGELAAALDFGQGLRHGGIGLEIISFFEDETVSIGLPKDIKDKEEIDIEGAKGTLTRMIVGAMLQGMSPVVTLKEKNYYLVELIQGGILNREDGRYNPPLSNESEHPSFYAEIFSAVYSKGSNKISDVAGYERILLRSMIGMEGDVPIEAKAWAQYAYNLVATEYTDENDEHWPAWEEQSMSAEEFDALKVKEFAI
jgi:hypothetical protein